MTTVWVPETKPDWRIRIFLDEACPLCAREGRLLERLDRSRGRVDLEDLSAPKFDATRYGLTQQQVEARIHGVLPDGRIVEGVDVFRHAYAAVGFERLSEIANWRGIRPLLDWLYLIFARNRLRLTGRGPKTCPVPEREALESQP